MMKIQNKLTRRQFIHTGLAATAGIVLVACGADGAGEELVLESPTVTANAPADAPTAAATLDEVVQLQPTPQCDDHDETVAQTAGPFYTPNTPERTSLLEAGITGMTLVVTGRVLTTDCQPIAGAIVDFWQADDAGIYDNDGFKLRGHQFTDADGNFTLETIMPGLYPGRTRHIHVIVQGPDTDMLTTQLYFPDEPENSRDGIFDEALIVDMADEGESKSAVFNFVLG